METSKTKKIFALVACAALLVSAALFPACSCDATRVGTHNVVSVASSARDGSGAKYGSGVLICRDGKTPVCLTNYHVISGNRRVMITPYDGNTVTAELLGYSEYHDIAVLGLTEDFGLDFNDVIAENLFATAVKGKAESIGDKNRSGVASYAGECKTPSKVIAAETVDNAEKTKRVPVTEVTCDIGEGMSGCAVIDGAGRLIGIGAYRERDESSYYAVSASVARAVMNAAIGGDVSDGLEVALFGKTAQNEGLTAYLTDAYGGAVVLGKNNKSRTLHPLGFEGTFLSSGFQVNAVGDACPLPVGALITKIGGAEAGAGNMNEVFAALYAYRLTDDASGEAMDVQYSLENKTATVALTGGGFSLIKK